MTNFQEKVGLIWSIAELLHFGRKAHEYQDVILPLIVLKRLDSVLAPTKADVLRQYNELKGKVNNLDPVLTQTAGFKFYILQYMIFKTY
ncbi:MAG: type I restriction-modification system subunit M N-terminal domain-containing protein [Candidatus Absconditabacterales bacterium]